MADQINNHHAANRERLLHRGQIEMQQVLEAQKEALVVEYANRTEGYESRIKTEGAQVVTTEKTYNDEEFRYKEVASR